MRRSQSGQAIAIVGLMITVLIGMVAIAVDGARAYAMRRDLQAATDAAALAAADKLQQSGSYVTAEQTATAIFGANLRLYSSPTCLPGYAAPGASGSYAFTCTYTDGTGTSLRQSVSALGPQGSQFTITATRPLILQFGGILTNGVSPILGATAGGSVGNLAYTPTIAALDQAGCGGAGGNAITIQGGGTVGLIGDLVSAGTVSIVTGSLKVAGDIYARCQSPVPGTVTLACYPSGASTPCTSPDVSGATRTGFRPVDPNYPPPSVVGVSQGAPAADVVLFPGIYAADPSFASGRCYFLSSGVYDWQAGYTNSAGFVSNELRPPDEPNYNNNSMLGHQMWNTGGANCAGSFQLTAVSGSPIHNGSWAIVLTATRTEVFSGMSYKRESAPSMCRTVITNNNVIQIQVSNVPGATGYNVYAAPPSNGCNGLFGFAGSISVSGSVRNDNTAGCPAFSGTSCSLGYETAVFDSSLLGSMFTPIAGVVAPAPGAYPPSGETAPLNINLPNQNPDRATSPAGDRANENQCDTQVGGTTPCPGPITPGAVEFYIPSGGCLNATTGADNFVFSGYQYNWIMVYEPGSAYPPANTCPNVLGAAADSAWVGLIYVPSAALNVNKAATFRTEATGGLMADTISFTGQLPTIIYSAAYAPQAPAARLAF